MTIKITNIQHKFRNKYIKYAAGTSDNISSVSSNNVENKFDNYFYEDDNGNLHSRLSFVGDKEISAYGIGESGGSGAITIVDNLTSTQTDCALSANQGRILKGLIDGKVSTWDDLEGKPSWIGSTKPSYSWSEITGKPSTFTPSEHTHNYTSTIKIGSTSYNVSANTVSLPAYPTLSSLGGVSTSTFNSHTGNTTLHITSTERTNWNTAYNNNHTHSNKSVLDGITSTKVGNWDGVVTNWNKAFYFDEDNNLRVKLNLIGEGEVSAYGAGTSGTGIITIVDNLTSTATDCALSANQGRVLKGLIDSKVSSWNDIKDKPSTFTPSSHTHTINQITNLQSTLDSKLNSSAYTAADILSKLKTVDGSGSGLDADTLDGVHLADIQKKVGYGWTTIYKVNNWSRIMKIDNYSNILLSINFDQSSQASNHLYLISTGYDKANIVQLGANNFNMNYGIKIRVTESSSLIHYVEIYSSYGYNGATDISVKCNYLKLDYKSTVTVYTAYTAGGDTVRKEITSSFNKIVSDLQGNADTATIADKLSVNAGSATNPIYFVNGIPVAGTYTFGNAGDNAAINNGILCRNLNADMLDGYHLKYDWSSNNKTCVKLFTIKISSSYVNTPVEFRINGRSGGDALISVKFDNYNGTDPGLISFTGYGIYSGYIDRLKIYKSATSTWEIWLTSQTQFYDSGKIYAVYVPGGFSFTIDNSASDTLPSYSTSYTCSKASIYGNIAGNSSTATKLQTARTLWGQSFDGTNNVSGNIIDTQAVKSKSGVWLDLYGAIGVAFYTNNTVKAAITTSGNFGIGTTSPSQKLHVNGNILSTGEITAYSDARLKTNIQTLEDRGYITPVTYIKDGKQSIGFLAQEVREKYPELVTEDTNEEKYLSLNYAQYTAVLQAQIIELNNRIKQLESKL